MGYQKKRQTVESLSIGDLISTVSWTNTTMPVSIFN